MQKASTFPDRSTRAGFSLIEVIAAVTVFAVGIVIVLGLLAPTTSNIKEGLQSDVAARLAQNVQSELERLRDSKGFDGFANELVSASQGDPIELVATADGTRVLRGEANDAALPADNDPDPTKVPPDNPVGIRRKDRYFRIEIYPAYDSAVPGANDILKYDNDPAANKVDGFFALVIRVTWPLNQPTGPDVDPNTDPATYYNETDSHAMDYTLTPESKRSTFLLYTAITR